MMFFKCHFFVILCQSIRLMMIKKQFFTILSWLNKRIFPSYIRRDLSRLKWYDKAIIAWRYWVTKQCL